MAHWAIEGDKDKYAAKSLEPERGHVFEVDLRGYGSRVRIDGFELRCIRDVKVSQPLDGPPIVTVEFVAESVKGIPG